jgi:hypothetical protein
MKLKLTKCLICSHWRLYLPNSHCPICGAHKIHVGNFKSIHVNSKGVEMVRGVYGIQISSEVKKRQIADLLADYTESYDPGRKKNH